MAETIVGEIVNITDADKMLIALNYYNSSKVIRGWFESRYKNKVYDYMRVIYNMSLHPRLAKYFCTISNIGQRFAGITCAIRYIRSQNDPNLLLVNYKELDTYGVHTPDELSRFINTIMLNIRNDNDPFDNNPYITLNCSIDQCIFDQQAQKTVFIYNDKDTLDMLCNYVKGFLGCSVRVTWTDKSYEITIQKLNNTKAEADQLYKNLKDHVFERDDTMCSYMIPLCQKGSDINRPYTTARLLNFSNDTPDFAADTVAELSKNIPIIYIVNNNIVNNNIVNNIVNNVGNVVNNINNGTEHRKNTALAWIKANPPNNLEKTTDYYSRYISSNNQGCANCAFGKIMKGEGFNMKKSNGARYWLGK